MRASRNFADLGRLLLPVTLPIASLVFLAAGPHPAAPALLWMAPLWLLIGLDIFGPRESGQAVTRLSTRAYLGNLAVLAVLYFANFVALGQFAVRLEVLWTVEPLAVVANLVSLRFLSGATAGISGITLAHELIHRRSRLQRWLGRAILITLGYDHFYVEHIRGHHALVGTLEDPATARRGETYRAFWRRSMVGQLKSAWRLELERLSGATLPLGAKVLRNRVLQGVVMETTLVALGLWLFGWWAVLCWILYADAAARWLEVVNYFQHWGLHRSDRRVPLVNSWVTDSWLTLHLFFGLSRHSDHHVRPDKPYHKLAQVIDGPRLPSGYLGTALLVRWFNNRFLRLANAELDRYAAVSRQP